MYSSCVALAIYCGNEHRKRVTRFGEIRRVLEKFDLVISVAYIVQERLSSGILIIFLCVNLLYYIAASFLFFVHMLYIAGSQLRGG